MRIRNAPGIWDLQQERLSEVWGGARFDAFSLKVATYLLNCHPFFQLSQHLHNTIYFEFIAVFHLDHYLIVIYSLLEIQFLYYIIIITYLIFSPFWNGILMLSGEFCLPYSQPKQWLLYFHNPDRPRDWEVPIQLSIDVHSLFSKGLFSLFVGDHYEAVLSRI